MYAAQLLLVAVEPLLVHSESINLESTEGLICELTFIVSTALLTHVAQSPQHWSHLDTVFCHITIALFARQSNPDVPCVGQAHALLYAGTHTVSSRSIARHS